MMLSLSSINKDLAEGNTTVADMYVEMRLLNLLGGLISRDTLVEIKILANMRSLKDKQRLAALKLYFEDAYETSAIALRKMNMVFQS